ncbi:hypothetical protein HYT74_01265 [Candidatus Daviesbacteria bacterium]|nr:hypothetical protein [Candidatus Daviesbacteria bacterium]
MGNGEILTNDEIGELNTFLKEDLDSNGNKLSQFDAVSDDLKEEQVIEEDHDESTTSETFNLLEYPNWREQIRANFPNLLMAAEVGASHFGQLLIKDITNPEATVFIDVPSAGKTITLNFFSGFDKSITLDNFTPASFVSQAANVKTEKLKDVDLLPRIKDKVLIIRDLAPLFGLRDDDLLRSMGVLTRVLDGEGLELHAGVHGQRGYSGDYSFMMLAASTPIPPKVFKLMGNLGSRLFFFNLKSKDKSEQELSNQLVSKSWKEKQKVCSQATQDFLKTLWSKYPDGVEWNKADDPEDCLRIITRCANLLARLRGSINVWKEDFGGSDEYSYQEPIIEMPDRISQILYNLARGHALISGRTNINHDDLGIVLSITLDSAPLTRSRLFRILIENDGEIGSEQLLTKLNCSRPTALKEMEVLKILKLVDLTDEESVASGRPSKVMTLKPEFNWFIEEEFKFIKNTAEEYYSGREHVNA